MTRIKGRFVPGQLGQESGSVSRADHPHDDPCPNCGDVAWDIPDDPQQCATCGSRICPVCGADFAEDYDDAHVRLTGNLGWHLRQWHAGVKL